jgi:hypothetical protein
VAGGSHQTVRLARGRHKSPADGACVMELASMLAGERFSDHPRCVDPIIAAFLRAFNDRLSPSERQRLVPYASAVVGTAGARSVTRARRRRCLRFAYGRERGGRIRVAVFVGLVAAMRMSLGAPEWAAREVVARGDISVGFELLDALIADGGQAAPPAVPADASARPARDLVTA